MDSAAKRLYEAENRDNYGKTVKYGDGISIDCYSKKQMKSIFPKGNFHVVGEYSHGKNSNGEKDSEDHAVLRHMDRELALKEKGKRSGILYWRSGYVACKGLPNSFVALLKNRVALVNETPNAVLLSIHQNSLPASRRVHGAQAFHARTEGSEALAESVQVALNAAVNPGNEKSRKVIDKSVYLMKNISCPAVLVECGFLSNAEEAARLCETDYQRKLAVTVAAGFLAGLAGGQAAA